MRAEKIWWMTVGISFSTGHCFFNCLLAAKVLRKEFPENCVWIFIAHVLKNVCATGPNCSKYLTWANDYSRENKRGMKIFFIGIAFDAFFDEACRSAPRNAAKIIILAIIQRPAIIAVLELDPNIHNTHKAWPGAHFSGPSRARWIYWKSAREKGHILVKRHELFIRQLERCKLLVASFDSWFKALSVSIYEVLHLHAHKGQTKCV
jgi:hypothetical protein